MGLWGVAWAPLTARGLGVRRGGGLSEPGGTSSRGGSGSSAGRCRPVGLGRAGDASVFIVTVARALGQSQSSKVLGVEGWLTAHRISLEHSGGSLLPTCGAAESLVLMGGGGCAIAFVLTWPRELLSKVTLRRTWLGGVAGGRGGRAPGHLSEGTHCLHSWWCCFLSLREGAGTLGLEGVPRLCPTRPLEIRAEKLNEKAAPMS